MPYRLNPKDKRCVQMMKAGTWQMKKCFETEEAARKHMVALMMNVPEAMKKPPDMPE